jgi:hypothetical protein
MIKKIILAVMLLGLIGVLIWGGVNRTLVKINDIDGRNENNQKTALVEFPEGNGAQQRGNADHETYSGEECDQENHQGNAIAQEEASSEFEPGGIAGNLSKTFGQNSGTRGGRGNGNGQDGGLDPLTASEIEALYLALDDEYHALAVYQLAIATLGEIDPFVEITLSEQRHVDVLVNQFNKHGLEIPENLWISNVPTFDSIEHACQAGVEAEIENADLYVQLLSMTDKFNLARVFTNLSNASLNSHLPQLEVCQ